MWYRVGYRAITHTICTSVRRAVHSNGLKQPALTAGTYQTHLNSGRYSTQAQIYEYYHGASPFSRYRPTAPVRSFTAGHLRLNYNLRHCTDGRFNTIRTLDVYKRQGPDDDYKCCRYVNTSI